jgi:hypothetical protein
MLLPLEAGAKKVPEGSVQGAQGADAILHGSDLLADRHSAR